MFSSYLFDLDAKITHVQQFLDKTGRIHHDEFSKAITRLDQVRKELEKDHMEYYEMLESSIRNLSQDTSDIKKEMQRLREMYGNLYETQKSQHENLAFSVDSLQNRITKLEGCYDEIGNLMTKLKPSFEMRQFLQSQITQLQASYDQMTKAQDRQAKNLQLFYDATIASYNSLEDHISDHISELDDERYNQLLGNIQREQGLQKVMTIAVVQQLVYKLIFVYAISLFVFYWYIKTQFRSFYS